MKNKNQWIQIFIWEFFIEKFANDLCFIHSVVYLLVSEKSKQNKTQKICINTRLPLEN